MAKVGRPTNYRTEDIIEIINQYIRYTEGTVLLNASKIANYATKELRLDNFKYYVINRNKEAKAYLDDMNEKIKSNLTEGKSERTALFRTLDIEAILELNSQKLATVLQNINTQIEQLNNKYADVVNENIKLKTLSNNKTVNDRIKNLEEEIRKLKIKNKELEDVNREQKAKYDRLYESVMNAWETEAETVLKKVGVFVDDGSSMDDNAIIESTTEDIISIDRSLTKKEFMNKLEKL